MEIVAIEAIALSHSLDEGRGFGSARGTTDARFTTLVRLETTDGTIGWGEAFAPPRTVATLIDELFEDRVIGTDPFDTGTMIDDSYTDGYHFGRGAFTRCAVAGIDTACWDLMGKATGRPIHQLLGGQGIESVVPYASTGYVTEWDQDIAEPMDEAADEDFTAAKIKIGRGIEDDVERVATAREILGDDAHLMVDYNGNYRAKRAIRSIRALAEYDLTWAEEPVPAEHPDEYRAVSERVDVPLAGGEAHFSRFEFAELIDVADIVQPNLGRCGGLSEAQLIAEMATTENVATVPHVWNSGVGVAAALQFLASVPRYPHSTNHPMPPLFEFDRSENPLRHEILVEPFDPTDGSLAVPQGPGLGIEVDRDAVEQHRID